ncbi:MAG: hypothetical protein ACRDDZ_11615 [Marinifilaceae bacterium]
MKGLQIDIYKKIINAVTPKGAICVALSTHEITILGKDTKNGLELDWGQTKLVVGDKLKITAIEGEEYDPVYSCNRTDEILLTQYEQLKKFLTKEGMLK